MNALLLIASVSVLQEVTTTPAMQAGLVAHSKLQAELSTLVDIEVETPEDAWGLKLLNTVQGIHQLLSEGMTRELFIFGHLQVRFVRASCLHLV